MNYNIPLSKNFATAFNRLSAEYGEEMQTLNGFSDKQLGLTTFIDNFVDTETVADATIDGNANVGHKDIVSLESEMSKPQLKMLSFNKIYYELNKKYNFKTANEWLRKEWTGEFYLHDAASATFKPYCYYGKETLQYRYKGEEGYCSFIDLYNKLEETPIYDKELSCDVIYPIDLFVKDCNGFTEVTRMLSHKNVKPMRHIKLANGPSIIVTEDHPMMTSTGDVPALECQEGSLIKTYKPEGELFKGTSSEFDNWDFGYLTGMFLAEGTWNYNAPIIYQTQGTPVSQQIEKLLNEHDLKYSIKENRAFSLKVSSFSKFLKHITKGEHSFEKRLDSQFINYSLEFMQGMLAGIFDGDGNLEGYKNRHGIIRINSKELLNQLNFFLRYNNIFSRDRTPYLTIRESSFSTRYTMYGIGFSIGDAEDFWYSINSIKIQNNYIPRQRKGNFKQTKYKDVFNEYVQVISNTEFIEQVDEVYDITTKTGHFICNDILSHNCFAYDLEDLVNKGLYFIDNFNAQPPQHLTTYTDFVGEFVSYASNRSSGETIYLRPFVSFPLISGVAA